MVRKHTYKNVDKEDKNVNGNCSKLDNESPYNVIQMDFVKSALTINPCMVNDCTSFVCGLFFICICNFLESSKPFVFARR